MFTEKPETFPKETKILFEALLPQTIGISVQAASHRCTTFKPSEQKNCTGATDGAVCHPYAKILCHSNSSYLMFSQDSPKSIFYPNTGTKKGRKCVISPVLIKLNQELHLYSLFSSTMASKLLLQKRSFDLLSSKCIKIHYKPIRSSCKFYVLGQPTLTCLESCKVFVQQQSIQSLLQIYLYHSELMENRLTIYYSPKMTLMQFFNSCCNIENIY